MILMQFFFPCKKEGGHENFNSCMEQFWEVVETCRVEDLGYDGHKLT